MIDLLHDIEVGVHIRYQPATSAFQTCNNHLNARTNPEPVARENERELGQLGQLVFLSLSFSYHQLYHLGIYLGSCICPKWKIYVVAHRRPT